MKTVLLYSLKGGVGKSAAAVNIAYAAAQEGRRTLLCDLDAQGSASFYFRVKPKGTSAKKLMKEKLAGAIKGSDYENLDILPSSFSYRKLPVVLADAKKPHKKLADSFDPFSEEYDLLVLDSHAGIDVEAEGLLRTADRILMPIIPTPLSVNTYRTVIEFLQRHELNRDKVSAFFSMVDGRRKLHREVMENLREREKRFLSTAIPYSAEVEKMGSYREPLLARRAKTKAALAYAALWKELSSLL
ncbi:MAG: ParA family protein [Alkalispirochaetaceae bacterium]